MEWASLIMNGAGLVMLGRLLWLAGNHDGRIVNLETWRSRFGRAAQNRSEHV